MNDCVLKRFERAGGHEQVLIVRRADGIYSYRRQWFSAEMNTDPDSPIFQAGQVAEGEWGPVGPYCGLYDSAHAAEQEALSRVLWLRDADPISPPTIYVEVS